MDDDDDRPDGKRPSRDDKQRDSLEISEDSDYPNDDNNRSRSRSARLRRHVPPPQQPQQPQVIVIDDTEDDQPPLVEGDDDGHCPPLELERSRSPRRQAPKSEKVAVDPRPMNDDSHHDPDARGRIAT